MSFGNILFIHIGIIACPSSLRRSASPASVVTSYLNSSVKQKWSCELVGTVTTYAGLVPIESFIRPVRHYFLVTWRSWYNSTRNLSKGEVPEDDNICHFHFGDQLNAEESESNPTLLQKFVACCLFNGVNGLLHNYSVSYGKFHV
jgi:hypothetical protein